VAVVGKRFTVVIPKVVRAALGLKEGQKVLVKAEGGKVVIEPLPLDPYGVLEEVVERPYVEEEDEALAEEWLRRHVGRRH